MLLQELATIFDALDAALIELNPRIDETVHDVYG
jgi:hypothetical protein